MEMGYHAEQAAPFCDGETPLELLIEQIAEQIAATAAYSHAAASPGAKPASPASPGGEHDPFRENAELTRTSSLRGRASTALGTSRLRNAAQMLLGGAKLKSRPPSAAR